MSHTDLNDEIKQLLVENLMLKVAPAEIKDDEPLFGEHGLGLDSIDALEIVVAVEKRYGVKIPSSEVAREALRSVGALADYVAQHK